MCVCANAFEQIFRYNLLASTAKFRNANNEHFSKISKIYCHLFAIKGKETATKKLILDKLNCILLRHGKHLWHFIFIFHVAKVLKWKLSYHFHWMRYYSLAKDQNQQNLNFSQQKRHRKSIILTINFQLSKPFPLRAFQLIHSNSECVCVQHFVWCIHTKKWFNHILSSARNHLHVAYTYKSNVQLHSSP